MAKYKIVSGASFEELESNVNHFIGLGYKPIGMITMTPGVNKCQAMYNENAQEGILDVEIKSGRAVGNTTRLANEYIELFFQKGEITPIDHSKLDLGNRLLKDIIIRRLISEHGIDIKELSITEKTIKRQINHFKKLNY